MLHRSFATMFGLAASWALYLLCYIMSGFGRHPAITKAPRIDHRHHHLAVAPAERDGLATYGDSLAGQPGALLLLGILAALLLLGKARARAAAPDPQPAQELPRPRYGPGHRTPCPLARPYRPRKFPDWYCCCRAANQACCGCDRTGETQ